MSTKIKYLLPLMSLFLLASCTSGTTTGGASTSTPASSARTSSYTPVAPSSPIPTKSDKQKVIDYVEGHGSLSSGDYLVSKGSKWNSNGHYYTEVVFLSYSPDDDTFNLVGQTQGATSDGTVMMTLLGGAKFSWGSYKLGFFLADYEYENYEAVYTMSKITFSSDGSIVSNTFNQSKLTFPDSFDSDVLKKGVSLAGEEINHAVAFYNTLSLPSLI
jgi:hypothetical protein